MIIIMFILLISSAVAQDVYGCTDPEACNYNPEATIDDWSCEDWDCEGVCGGDASYDDYEICCDSPVHMWPDWDGDGLGWPYISTWSCEELLGWVTNNDDPVENCFSNIVDCAGTCDGTAVEDNCGNCDVDPENDCVQDCMGIWGGGAYVDDCDVCCGGESGIVCSYWNDPADFGGDMDCEGFCGGAALVDDCGVCCAGGTGLECNVDFDCNGECFGTATIDDCGICSEGGTGLVFNADMDCLGTCFGNAEMDVVEDCCDPALMTCGYCQPPLWVIDCNGDCFGTALIDDCGICCDGETGLVCNVDIDCNGDCFGTAVIDDCGVCCEGATELEFNADIDCTGTCFGTAVENECGCVGGTTGLGIDYCMGCMDPESLNYDPDATVWDDSCDYLGDVNDDDSVDIGDVVYLVAVLLGELEMTDYMLWVGDMNDDLALSIVDIVWLVDFILNG